MTEDTYNPIATLTLVDDLIDGPIGPIDLITILGIVAQHGCTRRGAAIARAYLACDALVGIADEQED